MSKRVEDKAIDAWAVYEYREHPKGLYHTCFVDGYKEGYEQAEKDTIERVCDWLESHLPIIVNYYDEDIHEDAYRAEFIDLFRTQMDDEKSNQ